MQLYQLAVSQGNPLAQNALGRCYYYGNGVPRDPNEAVRLFRLSAAQGNVDAQISLREI